MLDAITARILAMLGHFMGSSISGFFWSDRLALSTEARDDLNFWQHNIVRLNGCAIWFSPSVTRVAYSDASGTGCGGYVVELGPVVSHGQWSVDQAACSSRA